MHCTVILRATDIAKEQQVPQQLTTPEAAVFLFASCCCGCQGLDADTSSLSAELRQLQASIKAEQEGLADFREVCALLPCGCFVKATAGLYRSSSWCCLLMGQLAVVATGGLRLLHRQSGQWQPVRGWWHAVTPCLPVSWCSCQEPQCTYVMLSTPCLMACQPLLRHSWVLRVGWLATVS